MIYLTFKSLVLDRQKKNFFGLNWILTELLPGSTKFELKKTLYPFTPTEFASLNLWFWWGKTSFSLAKAKSSISIIFHLFLIRWRQIPGKLLTSMEEIVKFEEWNSSLKTKIVSFNNNQYSFCYFLGKRSFLGPPHF